jgi:flagellar hook-basal body complex protein FliE
LGVNPIYFQKTEFQPTPNIEKKEVQGGDSFRRILDDAINQTNETDAASREGSMELLTQQGADLHTILINAEKADIALQYTLQIRNKLLDAYNEIMRMQV